MKHEHAIYLLWGDNSENRDSMMKQSHSLWYAAPSKNPRWLRLRTHTHADCSVLLMSAYLSPVNANPPASYKPLFLFKHHLHPPCLLQTLPPKPPFPSQCHIISWSTWWDTKWSPIILTFLWFGPHPMAAEVGKTPVGERTAAEGEHAAWMHERRALAPLPLLSYSVSQIRLMAELLWPWDM